MTRISGGDGAKPGRAHRDPRAVRAMQGGAYGSRAKDRRPFVCSVCGEAFRSSAAMQLHVEEKHRG